MSKLGERTQLFFDALKRPSVPTRTSPVAVFVAISTKSVYMLLGKVGRKLTIIETLQVFFRIPQ